MKGQFVQTTSDNKRLKGKFFMKKPGRVRFEYSPPSKQLVVSDGHQIAIQDLDINTDDRVMVDQTPFRVLLRKDVDLVRDARILEVQEAQDLLIVALQDKSKDASGRVRLFLATAPALELKEWVTTDAQGVDTRIEVSNLDRKEAIDAGLFKITSPTLKNQ
jgi:outer membrane lipoprotein-sorting protein